MNHHGGGQPKTPSAEEMEKIQKERDAHSVNLINGGARLEVSDEQIESARVEMNHSVNAERINLKEENNNLKSENKKLHAELQELKDQMNQIGLIVGGKVERVNADSEIEQLNRKDLSNDEKAELKSRILKARVYELYEQTTRLIRDQEVLTMSREEFEKKYPETDRLYSVDAKALYAVPEKPNPEILSSHEYRALDSEHDLVRNMKNGNIKAVKSEDVIYFVRK